MAAHVGMPTPALGTHQGVTGQVSVLTSATQIVPPRPGHFGVGRAAIIITNLGTNDVYIGFDATVTTGSGDLLAGTKGAFVSIPYQGAVWAVASGSSQTVSYMEIY